MQNIGGAILKTVPLGWQAYQLYIGVNSTISIIQHESGTQRAGLAATPSAVHLAQQSRFKLGFNEVNSLAAISLAELLVLPDLTGSAVGLATLNALLEPDPTSLEDIDAADWLVENGVNKNIGVVGRFPFIEELEPVARQLWIFELDPQPGEYHPRQIEQIIPRLDILAITSSTLVNHTLEDLLEVADSNISIMLLGPSTPLSPVLFDFGVSLLSGVQVVDLEANLASIINGVSFRKMTGVRRVTMRKPQLANL